MWFSAGFRIVLLGTFATVLSLVACVSAPASEGSEPGEETAESALNGCGYHIGNGPLIGRAPNACVPGTKDTTSAACAHPNARRTRSCNANCMYGNFGTCECSPTSCAGRVCGDDGCGGSCGTCAGYQQCNATGTKCFGSIAGTSSSSGGGSSGGGGAACAGKTCGPDGLGGSCGTCPAGATCNAGSCVLAGPSCKANTSTCSWGSQCCSGNCYVGTLTPTCVACMPSTTVAFCTKDSECCSGLCDSHDLNCVNICKSKTSSCTNSAQCCSGSCKLGTCL